MAATYEPLNAKFFWIDFGDLSDSVFDDVFDDVFDNVALKNSMESIEYVDFKHIWSVA